MKKELVTLEFEASPCPIQRAYKLVAPDNLERLIRETLLKGKGGHQAGEGLLLF